MLSALKVIGALVVLIVPPLRSSIPPAVALPAPVICNSPVLVVTVVSAPPFASAVPM